MKKILLSFILIITFGAYTYLLRSGASSNTITEIPVTSVDSVTYVGDIVDAFYGNVQVSATFSGSRLIDVTFLEYPNDQPTSVEKSTNAMPILKSEAIAAQSADVDTVSGATYTSGAFIMSLSSALAKAKNVQ